MGGSEVPTGVLVFLAVSAVSGPLLIVLGLLEMIIGVNEKNEKGWYLGLITTIVGSFVTFILVPILFSLSR
jgi:hypothetical protein